MISKSQRKATREGIHQTSTQYYKIPLRYKYFLLYVETGPWNSEWAIRASQECEQTSFQTKLKNCKQKMYRIKLQECMRSTNKDYTGQLFRLNFQRLVSSAFHKQWFHTGYVFKLWYQMQLQNFKFGWLEFICSKIECRPMANSQTSKTSAAK